jgi:hypothetical protein
MSTEFPFVHQSDYARIPLGPLPGDMFEGELHNAKVHRGLIAKVTEVAKVITITIGANNAGDEVGVTIDGGTVAVTAGADATATAALLDTALEGASFLSEMIDTVVAAAAVVTVTFVAGFDPTVVEYSPDATTATVATTTAAVVQQKLLYGMGVVRDVPSTTANFTKVRKPTSLSDVFAGVLLRTHGTNLPAEQIRLAGQDPDYLCPGYPYTVVSSGIGIVVEYVGDAPAEDDDVYFIMSGANAGYWSTVDGGTSQVSTLTLTTTAADTFSINYDGYPEITFTANGTEATDATTLTTAWNASPFYSALGTIENNGDGTVTITFADRSDHTFTDNSGGTTSVAESIDTDAVAATAQLRPEYSWAQPSAVTGADPDRAYLRLSNP